VEHVQLLPVVILVTDHPQSSSTTPCMHTKRKAPVFATASKDKCILNAVLFLVSCFAHGFEIMAHIMVLESMFLHVLMVYNNVSAF